MSPQNALKSQPARLPQGTGVAIITPFSKDGSVDFKSLETLVEHVIKGKVEYIVAIGTTGESVTLTKEEKAEITQLIVKVSNGRVPIVLGIGGNNTSELVHTIEKTDLTSIHTIISVSPYYNRPNQEGLYQHYKTISEASPLPIMLYNVPGRTGCNMTEETTLRLAHDFENITGIKEASGSLPQMMNIIKNRPKDFHVISGDDALTLPLIACGGDGIISVVANAYPGFSEMVRLALSGKHEEARKLHYKFITIIGLLFADGSPGGIKAVLEMMGICTDHVRQPLANINKKVYDALAEEMKLLK